jgi:quercetin dioxygenase-like cupin family protein
MRILTIEAGGHSPRHQHPWPHINYVIEGKGELYHAGETSTIGPGSVAYLPADTDHQFRNTGSKPLKFICIVPREGEA